MSTKLHDLARNITTLAGLTPRTATSSTTGGSVDLIDGDHRCFAVQQVGTVSGSSATLAGKIQESSDLSSWTDISGATFTSVTSSDNIQTITFDRTARYVRYVGSITGTSPSISLAVIIGEQKKQV